MAKQSEEAEVRSVLEEFIRSIYDKDAAGAITPLADDTVIFDLAPPLRMNPADARNPRFLEDWFATWRSPIAMQASDLRVVVGGDIAYAFGLRRMIGVKTDGEEVDMWFRTTACFAREADTWRITHMHNSVPFAMDGSNRALLDLQPN